MGAHRNVSAFSHDHRCAPGLVARLFGLAWTVPKLRIWRRILEAGLRTKICPLFVSPDRPPMLEAASDALAVPLLWRGGVRVPTSIVRAGVRTEICPLF